MPLWKSTAVPGAGLLWPLLALAWTAPPAPERLLPALPLRLLPGFDLRRIPGHVADDLCLEGGGHQMFVQAFGNPGLSKPVKDT